MNPADSNNAEAKRQTLLGQLLAADATLRGGLHPHGTDAIARAHLERALAHVREAYIAINEPGRARTVQRMVEEIIRVEQMCEEFRQQPPPGITVKPFRV